MQWMFRSFGTSHLRTQQPEHASHRPHGWTLPGAEISTRSGGPDLADLGGDSTGQAGGAGEGGTGGDVGRKLLEGGKEPPVPCVPSTQGLSRGELYCPHCNTHVGSFNWNGKHCTCSFYERPAFQLSRHVVKLVRLDSASSPSHGAAGQAGSRCSPAVRLGTSPLLQLGMGRVEKDVTQDERKEGGDPEKKCLVELHFGFPRNTIPKFQKRLVHAPTVPEQLPDLGDNT